MAPQSDETTTTRPLSELINIATRSVHAKLNKVVICRLPLAIPPQAEDPSNYVSGLLHITSIYSTFESLWRSILNAPLTPEDHSEQGKHSCKACKPSSAIHHPRDALDAPHQPMVCSRIHSILAHLHTPDLERKDALRADIQSLTGWSTALLEEQLASTSESPILGSFLMHISRAVEARPHTLLAYAWVLYMALFSGGRFIRASLARVDPSFWDANVESKGLALPLRFLTFEDGDEIKLYFKKRMSESSESLLTAEERDDIVAEAKRIFYFMVEIVEELDGVCGTDGSEVDDSPSEESVMSRVSRLLGLRTRDSVVVTKERRGWGVFRSSSDNGNENGISGEDDASGADTDGDEGGAKVGGHHENGEHVRFHRTD